MSVEVAEAWRRAVRTLVHLDLVKTGRWSRQLGSDYTSLQVVRQVGDYGGYAHVGASDASKAIEAARRILEAVSGDLPDEIVGSVAVGEDDRD